MSETPPDSAAEAATPEHRDAGPARPGSHEGAGPPSSVPGIGRAELGQVEREPATQGARQLAETVRSVSRLEESD